MINDAFLRNACIPITLRIGNWFGVIYGLAPILYRPVIQKSSSVICFRNLLRAVLVFIVSYWKKFKSVFSEVLKELKFGFFDDLLAEQTQMVPEEVFKLLDFVDFVLISFGLGMTDWNSYALCRDVIMMLFCPASWCALGWAFACAFGINGDFEVTLSIALEYWGSDE